MRDDVSEAVEDAAAAVARAEQRFDRADAAWQAAEHELDEARLGLNRARGELRAANRAAIQAAKDDVDG